MEDVLKKVMTVGDVIRACEFTGVDVFDQAGKKYEVTKKNADEIYSKCVESMFAKGSNVCVLTFDNLDKAEGMTENDWNRFERVRDETMILVCKAMLDKIRKELDRHYWNANQKEMDSPFDNSGAPEYKNDYFAVRSYYWGDNEDIAALPNFETKYVKAWWYKHSNRGLELEMLYGFDNYSTLAATLKHSIRAIENDFGPKIEAIFGKEN